MKKEKKMNQIKLTFKDRDLNKNLAAKKWLKTCENVINRELKSNPPIKIFGDLAFGAEIWFIPSPLKN